MYLYTHIHNNAFLTSLYVCTFPGPYEFSCVQENSALPGDFVGSVSVTDRDLAPATTGFPVSMLTATIEVDDSVRTNEWCGQHLKDVMTYTTSSRGITYIASNH